MSCSETFLLIMAGNRITTRYPGELRTAAALGVLAMCFCSQTYSACNFPSTLLEKTNRNSLYFCFLGTELACTQM